LRRRLRARGCRGALQGSEAVEAVQSGCGHADTWPRMTRRGLPRAGAAALSLRCGSCCCSCCCCRLELAELPAAAAAAADLNWQSCLRRFPSGSSFGAHERSLSLSRGTSHSSSLSSAGHAIVDITSALSCVATETRKSFTIARRACSCLGLQLDITVESVTSSPPTNDGPESDAHIHRMIMSSPSNADSYPTLSPMNSMFDVH